MKKLYIIENEDQVKALGKIAFEKNCKIILVSPFPISKLEKLGVRYSTIEDYYEEENLQKEWPVYLKLINKTVEWVDKYFSERFEIIQKNNIKVGQFSWMYFYRLFHQILVPIFIVNNVIDKEEFETVYLPEIKDVGKKTDVFFESNPMITVFNFCLKNKRKEFFNWERSSGRKKDSFNAINDYFRKIPYVSQHIQSQLQAIKQKHWPRGGKKLTIAVLNNSEEFWSIRKELNKKFRIISENICFRESEPKPHDVPVDFEIIYTNINMITLIREKLGRYFDKILTDIESQIQYLKDLFETKKIDFFINCVANSSFFSNLCLSFAQQNNVVAINLQHGGGYGYVYSPKFHYMDLNNKLIDSFFAWGEGVKSYCSRYSLDKTQIVSVGSYRFKRLSQLKTTSNKVVVYAPTASRLKYHIRILPHQDYPYFKYSSIQKKIIDALIKNSGYKVVFKLYMSDREHDMMGKYIRETYKGYNNYRIDYDTPFRQYLNSGIELAIIDFQSTALIEALKASAKVIQYFDEYALKFEPGVKELLSKCSYCYDTLDDFLIHLDKYFNNPGAFPPKDNTEFLDLYCKSDSENLVDFFSER